MIRKVNIIAKLKNTGSIKNFIGLLKVLKWGLNNPTTDVYEQQWQRLNEYEHKNFTVTRDKIIAIMRDFFGQTITDAELRAQLTESLFHDFKLVDEPIDLGHKFMDGKQKMPKATGMCSVVGWEIDDYGQIVPKVEKIIYIGKYLEDGDILTNYPRLRAVAHELAHSVSQHMAPVNDPAAVEIESMFMEKLFNRYMLENTDRLIDNGLIYGITAEELQEQVRLTEVEDLGAFISRFSTFSDLLSTSAYSARSFNGDYKRYQRKQTEKNYLSRATYAYMVGEVVSRLLLEDYKNNPDNAIQNYAYYLASTHGVSLDEACDVLTNGYDENFNEALEAYFNYYSKVLTAPQRLNQSSKSAKIIRQK